MSIKNLFKYNIGLSLAVVFFMLIGSFALAAGNNLLTAIGNTLKGGHILIFIELLIVSTSATVGGGIIKYIAIYLYTKAQQNYIHHIREQITQHYWLKGANVAAAQNRLTNDIKMVSDSLLDPCLKILSCGLEIILSAIFVYSYSRLLLFLIIGLALIILILPKLLSKPVEKATSRLSNSNKKYLNIISNWINGLAVLQRYKRSNIFKSIFSKGSSKLEQATINLSKKTNEINAINYSVNILAQSIILTVTGILIINNIVEFGVFFSIGNFASTIFTNLVVVATNLTLLNSSHEVNESIKKQLDSHFENDSLSYSDMNNFELLSLNNLSFQASSSELIHYPDIEIKKGEKVLLLGDSGTGKSTLFKLILGLYQPTTGKIIFRNSNNEEIHPDPSEISYVPQEPILFPGTIEDNITLFNPKRHDEALYWASKFDLATDLEKFPKGINSQIDLDNNVYSGGQRQKIILARSKLYNSELLLIDEGTSAIDSKSTLKILKNLLDTDNTIIFIAHNLSPEILNMFDKKIYLKSSK
ncbi:ABC-type bacteriocin/lantibiotic exporter with double-glycine peptidase domain [Lactobacillus colini]|uniref:ABC-type bacteriocin/lantibiotic exporter with double-glycine peptidase domain n=1 Tax=Lactobacillus colini TaxID=1819254 RepID=A0ABS4MG97_9LACO|nr:ABC transporter ATP-binding protein [Lactobacillus colini]MBP2058351.1 ABC-type bacteriocin/lantibiotic exporter with double-glycine peptidase domain [Lactobacillus colini]